MRRTVPSTWVLSQCIRASRARIRYSSTAEAVEVPPIRDDIRNVLPLNCSGCGAFSQTHESGVPGFYATSRKDLLNAFRRRAGDSSFRRKAEAQVASGSIVDVEQKLSQDMSFADEPFGKASFLDLHWSW